MEPTAAVHQLHLGHVVLPASHPRADEGTCEIYSYLIEHRDGLIIVDTGPRSGHPVIDEMYAPQVVSIIEAMQRAGFDDRAVTDLVNTHLHFDHCGQNDRFGDTPIWVTQAEQEASLAEFYTVSAWASISSARRRLSTDGEAIAEGVHLLHTPGHTPGHQSITVTTANGLEVIAGQACYSCLEFEAASPAESDMHDASWYEAGLDSLRRLQSLDPELVHFSHDGATHRSS